SSPDLVGSFISKSTQIGSGLDAPGCRRAIAWSPSAATSIWTGTPALRKASAVSLTSSALSSTCRILFAIGGAFCCRKLDPKPAALAGLRLDPGAAAHAFGGFAHQRQPKAGSGIAFRAV